jgi:hypothetical protein
MTDIVVTHPFVSAKADGPDTTLIQPSDWNDDHTIELSGPGVVGRETAGAGPAELIALADLLIPPGTVLGFGGPTEPAGFFFPYGQAISRTTYARLFAVIGTTYGAGDGSTTFNLPDYRGVVLAGRVNMGGSDKGNLSGGSTLGAIIGAQSVTLDTTQMPVHSHTVTDPQHTHTVPYGGPSAPQTPSTGGGAVTSPYGGQTTAAAATGITVDSAGGGLSHPNVQPTAIVNFIIKY